MRTRTRGRIRARLAAGAVMLSLVALVALPAATANAAPQSCPKSINVTDGSWYSLAAAVATVCPGGVVNIGPSVIDSATITVDKAVKVSGAGQALTTINGRLPFDITSTGSLKLSGVTLAGGGDWGIRVAGSLTLTKVTVTHFYLTAIYALSGSSVTLNSDTLITANHSGRYTWEGGAGIYNDGGSVTLNGNAAVTDNVNDGCVMFPMADGRWTPPVGGFGGGILSKNDGSITLNDQAVVSGNTIKYCDQTKGPGPIGDGGGIFSQGGSVTLNDSARVTGNGAARGGGISGGSQMLGLSSTGATITLNDSATVSDNLATSAGGGIYNWIGGQVSLKNEATVSGNTSHGNAGGIYNMSGTVTMNDASLITGNAASGTGGGIYNTTYPYAAGYPVGEVVLNDAAAVSGNTPNDIAP